MGKIVGLVGRDKRLKSLDEWAAPLHRGRRVLRWRRRYRFSLLLAMALAIGGAVGAALPW